MRTLVFRDFAPSFKYYFLKRYNILGSISANMISSVTEGKATIHVSDDTSSDVFYNPGMKILLSKEFFLKRKNKRKIFHPNLQFNNLIGTLV